MSKTLNLLFDGDILVYQASSAVQKDIYWGEGLWTCHAYLQDAIAQLKTMLHDIYLDLEIHGVNLDKTRRIFAFSDTECNFRKSLSKTYKSNRANNRKPTCYMALRRYVMEKAESVWYPKLEGDDVLGILATSEGFENSIIISGDKDFKTVPGMFFDYMRDDLKTIDKDEAYYWLMYQTLVGDIADGYKGCPKMGAVTTKRLLDSIEPKDYWTKVVESYEKQGLTEDDALLQARLAHILHDGDYDVETGDIKMWTPKDVCD